MGAIKQMFQKLLGSIEETITRIPWKTKQTIKLEFYAVIFIFCIIGAIIGFTKGKNAATIGGEPIAASMNELFEFERSRQMRDGDFGSLLESNLITQSMHSNNELDKMQFRTREPMNQVYSSTLIEPRTSPDLSVADMNIPQGLIEGNYRNTPPAGDASRIDRRLPDSTPLEGANVNRSLAPLQVDNNPALNDSVNRLSAPRNESRDRIPNQIDLNVDKSPIGDIMSSEANESSISDRPVQRLSNPRDESKIPSQIDYSKEIIR